MTKITIILQIKLFLILFFTERYEINSIAAVLSAVYQVAVIPSYIINPHMMLEKMN